MDGTRSAQLGGMAAKHYQELVVWQVADAFRQEVYRLTVSGPIARDFKLCSQLRGAVGRIPNHLAEGFRRSSSIDNARFVVYAITSLDEAQDWLDDGVERGHFDEAQLASARRFIRRLTPGLGNYLNYLLSPEAIERSRQLQRARGLRPRRRRPVGGVEPGEPDEPEPAEPDEPGEPNEPNEP